MTQGKCVIFSLLVCMKTDWTVEVRKEWRSQEVLGTSSLHNGTDQGKLVTAPQFEPHPSHQYFPRWQKDNFTEQI